MVMVPNRMGRDKTLGKGNQLRPVDTGLTDQAASLFNRSLAIEEYRGSLHSRHLYSRVDVAHDHLLHRAET